MNTDHVLQNSVYRTRFTRKC